MEYFVNLNSCKHDPDFSKLISELVSRENPLKKLGIQGLTKNLMQKLPFDYFFGLKSLRILDSDINGFFCNSKYFQNIEEIEIQQMSDEKIEINQVIDEEFKDLRKLKKLNIFSGNVKKIPNSISSLNDLTTLGLSITENLPINLHYLPNLKEFGVSVLYENVVREDLLEKISKVKNLESFGYNDPFSNVCPDFKENLLGLESFTFDMLNVKELPSILPKMVNLKYLHLSNDLQSIPEWFINLRNLEYLTIEGLVDGKLPLFLKELPRLHTINLIACLDILMYEERINEIKNDFPDLKILGVNADY